jgi:spore coat protein U-like protein
MPIIPERWHRIGCAVAGTVAITMAAQTAQAATATATIAISATVVSTCSILATPILFGNYTGVVVAATSTLTILCTATTPYVISLDAGATSGATTSTRSMKNGSVLLNYGLFKDAAHVNNWGIISGTDTVAGTGNGLLQTVTVFGQIPAGQFVAPGLYTDTVTATLTY